MEVVGQNRPCKYSQISFPAQISKPVQEVLPVCINTEYSGSLDAPAYHVMQSSGCIQPRLSRHLVRLDLFCETLRLF
jgi:hypothetical protein